MPSILVVEDDHFIRRLLVDHLAADSGYEVHEVGTLREARALMSKMSGQGRSYDVAVLDVGLPDGDGREFCIEMRQKEAAAFILLLTGLDGEASVVQGLDAGADDYVTKPFGFGELSARIAGLLRRAASRAPHHVPDRGGAHQNSPRSRSEDWG